MFKRVKTGPLAGKFRFRKGKKQKACHPKPSTRARHIKRFGDSGGSGHKAYTKAVYQTRLQSIAKARAAPRGGGPSKKFLAAQKRRLDAALASM